MVALFGYSSVGDVKHEDLEDFALKVEVSEERLDPSSSLADRHLARYAGSDRATTRSKVEPVDLFDRRPLPGTIIKRPSAKMVFLLCFVAGRGLEP